MKPAYFTAQLSYDLVSLSVVSPKTLGIARC